MDEDPLVKLKRDIEEERTGHRYVSPIPRARFELDRVSVPRGENLSGVVVIEAGMKDLWLDRLDLFVSGVARSSGSPHTSTTLLVTRNASISAGESRQFPVWVAVPEDTPLGSKMLMLNGGPAGAIEYFIVEPEVRYREVAETFATAAGMELEKWDTPRAGLGVVARFQPKEGEQPPHGRLILQMLFRGDELVGSLTVSPPKRTAIAALSKLIRPDRQEVPFSIPANEQRAAESLFALLHAHLRRDANLPIPAPSGTTDLATRDLPITSSEKRLYDQRERP